MTDDRAPAGKKEKPLNYRQRASIQFVEQDEPAFIRAIKKRIGYREPAKLEDKFADEAETSGAGGEGDEDDDDIRNLREEERPQIVVMDPARDISREELEEEIWSKAKQDDQKKIDEGRILFRKPTKRAAGDSKGEGEDFSKRDAVPPKKNTALLSFSATDDDE